MSIPLSRVSVVVLEPLRGGDLVRCLRGLRRNITARSSLDVIVASRNGRIARVDIHSPESAGTPVTDSTLGSEGAFRNAAWQATRGEVVAFVTSDAVPDDRWLAGLTLPFAADPALGGVGGPIVPLHRQNIFSRTCYDLALMNHGKNGQGLCLRAANSAFRRTALEIAGGYGREATAETADDNLCAALQNRGVRMRVVREGVVYAHWPTRLADYILAAGSGSAEKNRVWRALPARLSGLGSTYRRARRGPTQPSIGVAAVEAVLGTLWQAAAGTSLPLSVRRVHEAIERSTPRRARVAVMSYGDDRYLQCRDRSCWHFPYDASLAYLAQKPADSVEALAWVEQVQRRGAQYLVIPVESFWWLEFYADFARTLRATCLEVWRDHQCIVLAMASAPGAAAGRQP